ncbi:hypothetical protein ACQPYE_08165 [Actinosynnema sp. CA-299493]
MEVGQEWAYRANQRDRVARVQIRRIGTKRPPRVLIRFVEDEYEGREEWVSPARLKTTWDKAAEWLAHDQRWAALHDASWRPRDDHELVAAEMVLDDRAALSSVETGLGKDAGILFIRDLPALAKLLDLDATELTSDPLSIPQDDGAWAVPFATMLVVAQRAAQVLADEVLDEVSRDEAKARYEAIHGSYYGSRRGEGHYFSPEVCVEADQRNVPARALVREWCGQGGTERHTELEALREEVFRLGKLVEQAATALRRWDKPAAEKLEKELGVPIEALRRSKREEDQ